MTSWPAAATALAAACAVALTVPVVAAGSPATSGPWRSGPPAGPAAVDAPARAALLTASPTTPAPRSRWGFPLTPRPVVVRAFSAPPGPYAAGHRGVDLAARLGHAVSAPADGTVGFAGSVAGRPVLVVLHAGGLRSTLEPVTATVPVGTRVVRGARVGTVAAGPGHCSPATCVHWGVLRGPTYLDPLRLVSRARVVLLPLRPR